MNILKKFGSLTNGAAVDSLLLTFVNIVTAVVGIVVAKLLSVYFSLEEYGTYSQAMLIVSTAGSLTILGLTDAVNYFYNGTADSKRKEQYIGTIFDIQYIIGMICAILIILCRDLIVGYFKNEALRGVLWIVALLPVLQNLIPMMQVMFVSVGKAKLIAARNFIISLARLASVLIACFVTREIKSILELLLLLDVAQVIYFYLSLKKQSIHIKASAFDYGDLREILAFSIPMAAYLLTNSLSRDIDKYVVSYYANTETVAIYSNAAKLLPFDMITTSFITVLIPIITRQVRAEQYDAAFSSFKMYLRLGYIATWMLVFGTIIPSRELMLFLYDEKYLPGLPVFVVYLLVDMIKFAGTSLIFVAKGKTKKLLLISCSALVLNLLLNPPAYRMLGMIGPALTTLLITLALAVALLTLGSRELHNSVFKLFNWREMALIVAELLAAGAVAACLRSILIAHSPYNTLNLMLTYGVYFVIMLGLNYKRIISCLKEINALK